MGAARNFERNTTMANIGTFTTTRNGFTGAISFFKTHRQADKLLEDEGL